MDFKQKRIPRMTRVQKGPQQQKVVAEGGDGKVVQRYTNGKGPSLAWNRHAVGLVAKALMLHAADLVSTDQERIDHSLGSLGVTPKYLGEFLENNYPQIFQLYTQHTGKVLQHAGAWDRIHKMYHKQGDPTSPLSAKGRTNNFRKTREHPDAFPLLREVCKVVQHRLRQYPTVHAAMCGWDYAEVTELMQRLSPRPERKEL